MYWPFQDQTPSKSEILSVIVAPSYSAAFQDQTPSQSEIFFVIVACLHLLHFQDQTTSQNEIFSVLIIDDIVIRVHRLATRVKTGQK